MTLRFTPAVLLALMIGCSSTTSQPVGPATDASTVDSSNVVDTGVADTTAKCEPPEIKCGTSCVDVVTDEANCGACGRACLAEQTCVGGLCQCAAPKALCAGACVDTQTDASNCGSCGKTCATGQVCSEGLCGAPCPTGQTRCGGVCVDTKTNKSHCGMCGKACAATEGCTEGVCGIACEFPQKNCGGTCVNVNFDANNCGTCGKVCPTGPRGTAGCTSGSCVLTCATGYGNCDDNASNGCEVDLSSTDANCGGCGMACTSFETCLSSRCECKTGSTRCSGVCVDITSSDANCGMCGRACPTGESCSSSTCSCKTGFTRCGTTCVNMQTDAANCGACGAACSGTCSAGKCCPAGEINCGGTCVDPTRNTSNCGACGTTCSGSTPYCVASACVATCPSGMTDCSGTCTTTANDSRNCGSCGNVCATGQYCVAGTCTSGGFPGSTIVTATEGSKINGWLGTPAQLWTLCYSKAINGGTSTTFHSLCDGKGPSITLARLSTGKVIGGYAPLSWSTTSSYTTNNTAFLFSITNDFKHTAVTTMTNYFTYNASSYGPTFGGGHDWTINSALNGGYCNIGYTYICRTGAYGSTTCRDDFCGNYNTWTVAALEVWVK